MGEERNPYMQRRMQEANDEKRESENEQILPFCSETYPIENYYGMNHDGRLSFFTVLSRCCLLFK